MADIYQNGDVNIAATAAPDGRSWCFFERDPLLAKVCVVEIEGIAPCMVGDTYLPYGKTIEGLYAIAGSRFWQTEVESGPLNGRAWVLKERVLAPRTLHFGRRQLFWECHETVSFAKKTKENRGLH